MLLSGNLVDQNISILNGKQINEYIDYTLPDLGDPSSRLLALKARLQFIAFIINYHLLSRPPAKRFS